MTHPACATVGPASWSEKEHVRWKTPIHGKAWSSPVVLGDQVWMTTATEDARQLFAVCVDKNSGKVVHDLKLFDVPNPQFIIPFNSPASPTPAIEPGRVYVTFGSPGTACLDTSMGTNNTGIGFQALYSNVGGLGSNGTSNTAVGFQASLATQSARTTRLSVLVR